MTGAYHDPEPLCELPHQTPEDEDACDLLGLQKRLAAMPRGVPGDILQKLIEVAAFVSLGRGHAYSQVEPYPDAKARFALGALYEYNDEMEKRAKKT